MLLGLGCKISDTVEDGLTGKTMMKDMQAHLHEDLPSGGYALVKSTFDRLGAMGYPIDENDFVIVDEKEYPELMQALKDRGG